MNCRHCQAALTLKLLDLGSAPLSNAYLSEAALYEPEKWYPLSVRVCEQCWLVQTQDSAKTQDLFGADYAYFSGYSQSWLDHCRQYVADITQRMQLGRGSLVVEIAANDGYLLQHIQERSIPCVGVEPTASTAAAAVAKGIPILQEFFSNALAETMVEQGKQADLLIANNVLAHVPDINDFVAGFATLLKPKGVATFEFPHLLQLITHRQFDTVYHEHFSYLSLTAVEKIFAHNGLSVFDVQEHSTHGGSLRVFAQRADNQKRATAASVSRLLRQEDAAGIRSAGFYGGFQSLADKVKNDFLGFLVNAKANDKRVAAYGAAAKGNTLINYAGIRPDLLSFIVDRNPAKQGKYMPGSRIPIVSEYELAVFKPDFLVLLPWNLRGELAAQLHHLRAHGTQFVTAVPQLEVW